MNKNIEHMLSTLLVGNDAKDALRGLDKILNSKSSKIRESASALLVTAGEGCGFTSYGRVYSEIVNSSLALKVKGKETFIELVYPKDNERDERLFFASPRRMASIRNHYYGTMLISLKEFEGNDLIKSESFVRLLEFVSLNKGNIHFMFQILPNFSAKNQLVSRLQEVTNVTEVVLDNPTIDSGYTYVVSELKKQGYTIDEKALTLLEDDILPEITSGKSYMGYRTLNSLLERVHLEVAMAMDGDEMILKGNTLKSLKYKFEREEELSKDETVKIGFGM